MKHAPIIQIPTNANLTAAWDQYSALVMRYYTEPELMVDTAFIHQLGTALSRYLTLFNSLGEGVQ